MNIKDVAEKAGVSISTVSRVVNGSELVKRPTRSRVLRAMLEMNYYPNLHARSLARGHSRTMGIIVSNLQNPFFLDIFCSFEARALQQGYEVLLADTGYRTDRLKAGIRLMIGRRVGGLAAIVSEMDPSIQEELVRVGIPVVFYDVATAQKNISVIRLNYRHGMCQAVEYLYSLGHRRMAYIGYPLPLGPTEERKSAFLETMAAHSASAFTVAAAADGFVGGREATRELLQSGSHPTAVLCVNDITAVGVLRELRDQRISVPKEISVIGFDNIPLAEFSSPSLTTLDIPRQRIGHLVFDLLTASHSAVRSIGRETLISPELIVRESTGPVP
jgi:LacI family transcriptional regulator